MHQEHYLVLELAYYRAQLVGEPTYLKRENNGEFHRS